MGSTSSIAIDAQPPSTQTEADKPAKSRTVGSWLFDTLVYPGINNVGVFLVSVYATYKTTFGAEGGWLKERGNATRLALQKRGFSRNASEVAGMVLWSFLDGCLVAPFVKLLEDRRGKTSKAIDHALGTQPDDPSVYDEEPRQSWKSVLGGRAATALVVVPTAVALQKTGPSPGRSWNDVLFHEKGVQLGQWTERKLPVLGRRLPWLNMPALGRIVAFEFFYTAVCTAGLYFSSRFLARLLHPHRPRTDHTPAPLPTPEAAPVTAVATATAAPEPVIIAADQGVADGTLTLPPRTGIFTAQTQVEKVAHAPETAKPASAAGKIAAERQQNDARNPALAAAL